MPSDSARSKLSGHQLIDSLDAALILQKFELFSSLRQMKASFVLVIPLQIQLRKQFVRVRKTKWIVCGSERVESFLELSLRRVELAKLQIGTAEVEIIGGKGSLIFRCPVDFLG